jgi:hypothetical protein
MSKSIGAITKVYPDEIKMREMYDVLNRGGEIFGTCERDGEIVLQVLIGGERTHVGEVVKEEVGLREGGRIILVESVETLLMREVEVRSWCLGGWKWSGESSGGEGGDQTDS